MAESVVPRHLREASAVSPYEDLRRFVARLPATVAAVAERWGLEVAAPYEPGGRTAWVAPVRDRDGRELVLKVGWRHEESHDEAAGLRAWGGDGAVRCHADVVEGDTSALLLERCVPGTSLDRLVAPEEADVVVAGLLRRLWAAATDGHAFRPLADMTAHWADAVQRRATAAGRPDLGLDDPGLARAGLDLWRTLSASATAHVLLLTDLHAENVLAAEREPWLVIDPKPYVGDPAYDPLQHLVNGGDRLQRDPGGCSDRMADLLDLDRQRLRTWLFARCVVESLDRPDLRALVPRLAP